MEQRAGIVLLAADGVENNAIAEMLGIGRVQVGLWRERYVARGMVGIEKDLPRGKPLPKIDVVRLIDLTTQSKPAAAAHWSTRTMAGKMGASGLKPHLVCGFKGSRDPQFVEKLPELGH